MHSTTRFLLFKLYGISILAYGHAQVDIENRQYRDQFCLSPMQRCGQLLQTQRRRYEV